MSNVSWFAQSLKGMDNVTLLMALEDIQKRIGDGVLNDNPTYVAEQKEKGLAIMDEWKSRLERKEQTDA